MSSPTTTRPPTRKFRVLAVDDNEIHRYALCKLLASAGFDVAGAHSGKAALEEIEKMRPDAVLLDIGLGDISGFEVCNQIRSSSDNNRVAIVFHSASGHANAVPHSNTGGADAFLTYPVDSEHLISVIRGCIQRRLDGQPGQKRPNGQTSRTT